jgi:arylsulfatase A-like enzyme
VKRDLWEGGHRVPFLMAWPGKIKPATVFDQLVGQTDLTATFADVVGVKLPNDAAEDSISFLHLLEDRPPKTPVRRSIIHHSADNKLAIRKENWVLMADGSGSGNRRPEPAHFREARGIEPHNAPYELFDLAADPGQTTNLYNGSREKARELRALLESQVESGRSAPAR